MNELKECAEVLIMKAAREAKSAVDALQFSQAANNVANTMAQLQNVEMKQGPPVSPAK